ncbi:FAD-binding oxidoreductase [Candidatus Saccharibacteria bacterium]|nr:FAD-binding oxidoreductase [Candidatus Saccharibacteria bacterium]
MTTKTQHQRKTALLLKEFNSSKNSSHKFATNKKSTNLFRSRNQKNTKRLNMRDLNDVIAVNTKDRTALVEGMCSYQQLVEETLKHNLMPAVVPQLKTITLGGAISGIGIESSSYQYGLAHETVLEMQILTGDGKLTLASASNQHKDLFYGFPNSYGTLGYALRLKIKLIKTKPFVKLRYVLFDNAKDYYRAMQEACEKSEWKGEKIDFIDGVIFDDHSMYLVLAQMTSEAPYQSNYKYQNIYYRAMLARSEDYLTIKDYIWRWDTDWFWCSKNVGAQNPIMRKLYGPNHLKSEFYMKLFGIDAKYNLLPTIDKLLKKPMLEAIIQDVQLPIQSAEKFLTFFNKTIQIQPIWNCPVRQLNPKVEWSLFKMKPRQLYVNFGFWDSVIVGESLPQGHLNCKIESVVKLLRGKKSLYSNSFYSKEEFWKLYNKKSYDILKSRYDPGLRFKDLYQKTVLKG